MMTPDPSKKKDNPPGQQFTIALPSGRLGEQSVEFFRNSGFADFQIPDETRELSFEDVTGKYRIVLVRNQDVPTYVLGGGADAGITGRDVMAERGYDLTIPLELGFGECHLAVASPSETSDQIFKKPHLRVATKYPTLAMDYFFSKGLSCEIIKLHGSIEIAPRLGLADCVVDLVSTGNTLRANGLVELDTVLHSSAVLVVNRSAYALQTESVTDLIQRFSSLLAQV